MHILIGIIIAYMVASMITGTDTVTTIAVILYPHSLLLKISLAISPKLHAPHLWIQLTKNKEVVKKTCVKHRVFSLVIAP